MTDAIQRLESAIEKLETLKAESTHGRWVRGDRWHIAGVVPELGVNKCFYCDKDAEPSWVGRLDINGRRMKSHIHELDSPWWEHGIYADTGARPVQVINDVEEYGYMDDSDTELIVTLHRTIDAQLAILRASIESGANIDGELDGSYWLELALADAILGETGK